MPSPATLCLLSLVLVNAWVLPAAAEQPVVGAFTQTQIDQGRKVYATFCATCRGLALEGSVGPALVGSDFVAKWSGRAGAFFGANGAPTVFVFAVK
jgi:hypothetical protein